jgi:hypothetical protein
MFTFALMESPIYKILGLAGVSTLGVDLGGTGIILLVVEGTVGGDDCTVGGGDWNVGCDDWTGDEEVSAKNTEAG